MRAARSTGNCITCSSKAMRHSAWTTEVIDVGKVPLHVPVVVDVDVFAREDHLGELEVRHVRASPGSVDREEVQTRRGNTG